VKLYHFTSEVHLPRIVGSGELRVTETNARASREHAAPDAVWLTSDPRPQVQGWKRGSAVDKTAVRFTVEVPRGDVMSWAAFCRLHRVPNAWRRALADVARPSKPSTWFLVFRPIPRAEWVEVEVLEKEVA
jgi:hypothetical protein